ncbi:MAG: G5 domain-containing protein [Thermoleophilia bacterium]
MKKSIFTPKKRRVIALIFLSLVAIAIVACDKIEKREEVRTDAYSFATKKSDDCNLAKGQTKTVQQGKNGTREIKELVTYTNGNVTNKEWLSEIITLRPVDEILIIGGLSVQKLTENQPLPFGTINRDDASVPCGQTKTLQEGKNGTQSVTYELTFKCGKQDGEKRVVGTPLITTPPVDKIIGVGLPCPVVPPPNCDPNYTPCVPIDSDVDCAGGSGNGPSYVQGPVTVIGRDIYGLDRDSDGIGCE